MVARAVTMRTDTSFDGLLGTSGRIRYAMRLGRAVQTMQTLKRMFPTPTSEIGNAFLSFTANFLA